jgi:hypothetical protein
MLVVVKMDAWTGIVVDCLHWINPPFKLDIDHVHAYYTFRQQRQP